MKFYWKIFISIMLIAGTFFSVGVYYILYSSFEYSLEREISAAYEDNDILLHSLHSEIQDMQVTEQDIFRANESLKKKWVMAAANSILISTSNGVVPFRISDNSYTTLYKSKWNGIDNFLISELPPNTRGHEITALNNNYYIHTGAPITIFEETLYVENYRDITVLFENRNRQYRICYYLMLMMLTVIAVITAVVSGWLMKPIRRLSNATKQFANGNLEKRVKINGEDELAMLSEDFNVMAEKLEQTVDELKNDAQRQEAFVNNFSHELKTPLTSMIGYADMLRSKKLESDQIIEFSNYIFEEGKRLEALSMKLMELIILKKQSFPFQSIEIDDFFESIEGIMRPVFKKEQIQFTISCENAVLKIEPDLMKTVCINLLDNARKAIMKDGKISMVGKVNDANGYSISICDNGRGMEQSEISRITEAFYMVDKSRARSQGGAGLGLSICSDIVKLHEGTLAFNSRLGVGTCATIKLKGENAKCQS